MLAIAATCLGKGTLHTFTTPDGRSLEAAILQYDARKGKIQIERADGKKLWTLPSVFIEKDQAYVQQWIVADQFMSPIKFKIKGQPQKDTSVSFRTVGGDQVKSGEKTSIVYELSLANRGGIAFRDIRIEYRAFIKCAGYEGREDSSRIDGGKLTLDKIPSGETKSCTLPPIGIATTFRVQTDYDSYSGTSTSYEIKIHQENLKGFWVKVYGPSVDGKPSVREWCYPSDTMEDFAWQAVSDSSATASAQTADSRQAAATRRNTLGIGPGTLAKEDPEEALKLMKAEYAKRADPEIAKNIGYTCLWYLKPADIESGLEWLKKSAADDCESACQLLTGFYSTYYGHKNRLDVEQAVKYGQQALSLKEDDMPHMTMALAYARDGQFDKAVEHQEKAIQIFEDRMNDRNSKSSAEYIARLEKILEGMEQKLDLYKSKKVE